MDVRHHFVRRLSFAVLAVASGALASCQSNSGGTGGSAGMGSGGMGGGAEPAPVTFPIAKEFAPPARTDWAPDGCRAVPANHDVLPSRVAFKNLHADEANTDEVSVALAPAFVEGWTAEQETFNVGGPVFDSQGNLYFSASLPHEPVALISLEPESGTRRFAIPNTTGAATGPSAPMILSAPENDGSGEPKEMIFLGLYDRAFAIDVDGAVLWDVPTGLESDELHFAFGINYAPAADAIVGLTEDGFVYALDRRTGQPVFEEPFELPGENSPAGNPRSDSSLPPEVTLCLAIALGEFADLSEFPITLVTSIITGNGVKVANHFSVDAKSSSLWVAATAPDAEDGAVDGLSEFGALYRLDFVSRGDKYGLVEACHVSFDGGSSSSPTLRKDGTRAYVTDNLGKLIAVETIDCSRAWELDVGSVINGSIAVSSDNGELYAATRDGIFQVIDEGDRGVVRWVSKMDAFELPPDMVAMDVTIAGIGANAVSMQLAAGYPPSMFLVEGVAQLDRATGELRYFAQGGEATLAVMNSGPDGAVYLGNSGFRSATTNCMAEYGYLPMGGSPVLGGITKFAPERLDLLARDAICAASDRAENAQANRNVCPESAEADVVQIVELITQARWAGPQAIDAGDLTAEGWNAVEAELATAERALEQDSLEGLVAASEPLRLACDVLE